MIHLTMEATKKKLKSIDDEQFVIRISALAVRPVDDRVQHP
jgi:hypothetical protein